MSNSWILIKCHFSLIIDQYQELRRRKFLRSYPHYFLPVNKKQQKKDQQKVWNLSVDPQMPMILVVDIDETIISLIEEIVAGISAIGIQLVFLHNADMNIDQRIQEITQKYPHQTVCIASAEADQDIFDAVLIDTLNEDKLEQLKKYKRVPIAAEGAIEAFDPIEEKGNGFLYELDDYWSLFAAFVRVSETYKFPYDWSNMIKALQKS